MANPCESFLEKWQTILDEGFDFDAARSPWREFMNDPEVGLAAFIRGPPTSPSPTTAQEIMNNLNAVMSSAGSDDSLTLEEAAFAMLLYERRGAPIPDDVPMNNCGALSTIANSPIGQIELLLQALAPFKIGDEDSDEEDSGEVISQQPSPFQQVPPTPAVNPFQNIMPPTGTRPPAPSVQPAVNQPYVFPPVQPAVSVNPFQPQQTLQPQPHALFPQPTVQPQPAVGVNPFQPQGTVAPGPTMPGPALVFPAPSAQPAGPDLPYVTVSVRGLQPSAESRIVRVIIPNAAGPTKSFFIDVFISAGNIPSQVVHTQFSGEEVNASDNAQKRVIHQQNKKTIYGAKIMPRQLSNGVSDAGVCAQHEEFYVGEPLRKNPSNGAEIPFPRVADCPPDSNVVKSVNVQAPTSGPGGFFGAVGPTQPVAVAPTSGGMPTSGGPPPPGAIAVKVFQFKDTALPMLDMWQMPGPRMIAVGDGWYWFQQPDGRVVKSRTAYPNFNNKKELNSKHGSLQEQKILKIKAAMAATFGPNYATSVSGGASASRAFQAPGQAPGQPQPYLQQLYQSQQTQQPAFPFGGQTVQPGFQAPQTGVAPAIGAGTANIFGQQTTVAPSQQVFPFGGQAVQATQPGFQAPQQQMGVAPAIGAGTVNIFGQPTAQQPVQQFPAPTMQQQGAFNPLALAMQTATGAATGQQTINTDPNFNPFAPQ